MVKKSNAHDILHMINGFMTIRGIMEVSWGNEKPNITQPAQTQYVATQVALGQWHGTQVFGRAVQI